MARSDIKSSVISTADEVAFTVRGEVCWIISARPARRDERQKFYRRSGGTIPDRGRRIGQQFDALTDEEIEEAVRNDPDAVPLDFDWSKAVLVIPPKKKAISIRVDEDVLDYFKKEGAGYQRRINAVLRSYMQQKRKKRA